MAWERANNTTVESIHNQVQQNGLTQIIPGVNSTANVLTRDVVGNKSDYVTVPYSEGVNSIIAQLNTIYYHIHGRSITYPDHDDEKLLTAGAGAWDLTGAIIEVIPANVLTVAPFDLHWINISNISANGTIQVDIYSGLAGAEVLLYGAKGTRSTVQAQNGSKRIQIPQQPAGTRISCRLSDGTDGALTCLVSFEGHYYAS